LNKKDFLTATAITIIIKVTKSTCWLYLAIEKQWPDEMNSNNKKDDDNDKNDDNNNMFFMYKEDPSY